MLATRLAEREGLTVPVTEGRVEQLVGAEHDSVPGRSTIWIARGVSPLEDQEVNYLPVEMLGLVRIWSTFIDQGYCVNAGDSTFPEYLL
jgi:hypothetical protein